MNGTANAGVDFDQSSGTLHWSDSDSLPKTINIPITQDALSEGDEIFSVELSNPTGGADLGGINTLTITILDDDDSTVEFENALVSVDEASGSVTIGVSRNGNLSFTASVTYASVQGTATAGADFTECNDSLAWGIGDSATKFITVPILDDSIIEGYESFTIDLSSPAGNATIGNQDTVTITIADDDTTVIVVGEASSSVGEADGSVTLEVQRLGVISGEVSVDFATSNISAVAGDDYTTMSGTLQWADGDDSHRSVIVDINDDALDEDPEEFNFLIENPSVGAILGTPNSSVITINDNDGCHLVFASSTYQVNETGESIDIGVRREGDTFGTVGVSYTTTNGTATAARDFVANAGIFTWADGENSEQSISLTVLDDSDVEGTETFTLELSSPTGPASLGSPSETVVVIQDDEWEEVRVNTFTSNEQTRPSVAMDSSGNAVAVWDSYEQDGSSWGIYGKRYDSQGVAVGVEFQVNSTITGEQRDGAVAMTSDGRFVVVWESNDGSGMGIYFQRYDASGTPLGSETRANFTTSGDQSDPAVAMVDNGVFMVVWRGVDSAGTGVFGRVFAANGIPLISEALLNTTEANDQSVPAVGGSGTGFVAVWESIGQDGPASGIIGRIYSSTGVSQGPEFIVNTLTSGDQQSPSVSVATDGDFLVGWHDANFQDGYGHSIQAQRFLATGATNGEQFRVNSYVVDDQTSPAVAMNPQKNAVCVWQSENQDGSGSGIFGQVFAEDGTMVGPEFQTNTYVFGTQQMPAVTCSEYGDFLALWSSGAQDGSGSGVYSVRNALLPPSGVVFEDGFEQGDTTAWSAVVH